MQDLKAKYEPPTSAYKAVVISFKSIMYQN